MISGITGKTSSTGYSIR
uniref:Uncharacterized protein n=1 Tax=Malassezia globosa (strain ATCC MYA-4612 / CBS 7966) TaxID=425265 RepID=A8QEU3_MALGO